MSSAAAANSSVRAADTAANPSHGLGSGYLSCLQGCLGSLALPRSPIELSAALFPVTLDDNNDRLPPIRTMTVLLRVQTRSHSAHTSKRLSVVLPREVCRWMSALVLRQFAPSKGERNASCLLWLAAGKKYL